MTPFEAYLSAARKAVEEGTPYCDVCGGVLFYAHDHRPDETGLDDGPWLPGRAPRKKPPAKGPEEIASIRARAWATRRERYGRHGHR
jgi:hypothetical protein